MVQWCIDHLKKDAAKKIDQPVDGLNALWLCQTDKHARIINPPQEGITKEILIKVLENYQPDDLTYLGGTKDYPIYELNTTEILKRCLVDNENVYDWNIVMLANELNKDDSHRLWFKIVLYNKKTNMYSIRSYLKSQTCKNHSQNSDWSVSWSKPVADKSFWIRLKDLLVNA